MGAFVHLEGPNIRREDKPRTEKNGYSAISSAQGQSETRFYRLFVKGLQVGLLLLFF